MKKKLTRREFLERSVKGSVVLGGGTAMVAHAGGASTPTRPQRTTEPKVSGLDQGRRELAKAVMDELIPAVDGMPAASEAAGVEYLDRLARTAAIKKQLHKSLATIETFSQKRFGKGFLSLSRQGRVEALKEIERKAPQEFATLRDYVYEAYYTQPRVWKLIGYEFYATNQAGPRMKPFDESVLSEVRKKPRLYREAS